MGKKRKRNAEKAAADQGLTRAVMALLAQAMAEPDVARCTLSIDKATGLARLATSGADGRTATREIVGPGLALDTLTNAPDEQPDQLPSALPATSGRSGAQARAARDAQIVALAARGLTQTETARVLSVSQALVSKVLRAAAAG